MAPGKPQQTEEWRDRYADNKRKDYMLMHTERIANALERIAYALERAYPPPPPPEPSTLPA